MDTASVIIDDDDIILETNDNDSDKNTNNSPKLIRTNSAIVHVIDLEDDDSASKDNENNKWLYETKDSKGQGNEDFIKLLKSNNMLNNIVQKCLRLKNNKGISFIIQRNLIPLYKNADRKFKTSEPFFQFMDKILKNLKYDPIHKFSHLKSLCTFIKQQKDSKIRKKVPFITLTTDIKKFRKRNHAGKQKTDIENFTKKGNIIDNLNEDKVITVLDDDTDNENDEVVFVAEAKKGDECVQSDKENCKNDNANFEADGLLVPKDIVEVYNHDKDYEQVKFLEQQIEAWKKRVDQLEDQEVTNNYNTSPYVQCDIYKAKIVQAYKKLCQLTGNGDGNLIKQHLVRLHVTEDFPPGPVQRLEHFLNSSIDESGVVPLPDFQDVWRCVTESNKADNLGWDKKTIMNQAIMLFTHCGHALRKTRQKREYKDLKNLMHDKAIDDDDPAQRDPELLARLEENKHIAKANEDEIIDRYVQLEMLPKSTTLSSFNQTENHQTPTNAVNSDEKQFDRPPKKLKSVDMTYMYENEREPPTTANFTCPIISSRKNSKKKVRPLPSKPIIVRRISHTNHTTSVLDILSKSNNGHIGHSVKKMPNGTLFLDINMGNAILKSSNPKDNHLITPHDGSNTVQMKNEIVKTEGHIESNMVEIEFLENKLNETNVIENNLNEERNVNSIENHAHSGNDATVSVENIQKQSNSNGTCTEVVENNLDEIPGIEHTNDGNASDTQVKSEPIDVQELLDNLGNNYITTIFDIEDPFLIVEISSDSSSDDEL